MRRYFRDQIDFLFLFCKARKIFLKEVYDVLYIIVASIFYSCYNSSPQLPRVTEPSEPGETGLRGPTGISSCSLGYKQRRRHGERCSNGKRKTNEEQ